VLLVAAVASAAPLAGPGPIFVPADSDGPLLDPPVISSQDHVLKADVTLTRVTYAMLGMAMPPSTETLPERAPGVYAGAGPPVRMPGRWQLTVKVTRRGKRAFTARLISALPPASG
jgi:hypothetical protein